ncbi:unnamed protein product, partial [Polarella glacialis]
MGCSRSALGKDDMEVISTDEIGRYNRDLAKAVSATGGRRAESSRSPSGGNSSSSSSARQGQPPSGRTSEAFKASARSSEINDSEVHLELYYKKPASSGTRAPSPAGGVWIEADDEAQGSGYFPRELQARGDQEPGVFSRELKDFNSWNVSPGVIGEDLGL